MCDHTFEQALEQRRRQAVKCIVRLTRDLDRAEECVQVSLFRWWLRTHPLRVLPDVAWLVVVARNLVRTEYRRRIAEGRRMQELRARPNDSVESSPSPFTDSNGCDERLQQLSFALANLPPKYRSALAKFYHDGKRYQQIATETNEPLNTVRTRIRRALALLRIYLTGH